MRIGFGDLVRLNSGGPQLLVVDVDECDNMATAAWRDVRGKVHEHVWPTACLTRLCRAPLPRRPGHG